jgi:hypothetical protein
MPAVQRQQGCDVPNHHPDNGVADVLLDLPVTELHVEEPGWLGESSAHQDLPELHPNAHSIGLSVAAVDAEHRFSL